MAGGGWRVATLTAFAAAAAAALLPLAVFLVAVWLQGWQLQAVLTGSMRPTYPPGSLLVVGQVDASEVEVGMALVFEDPTHAGRLVTHRVVEVAPGAALQFVTQGDANAVADAAPVPARLVRGRVLWSVSGLGAALEWLQWPRSFLLLVVAPGLLLVGMELARRRVAGTGQVAGA